MGSIFSSAAVPDGPYAYKFTGFALWLLLESQDAQAVIDTMNPSPWRAHSTLLYGMRLDEATARRSFDRLRARVNESCRPVSVSCATAPTLFGDYPPFQMRVIGIAFDEHETVDELRRVAAASFGQPAPHAHFAHSSLIYDWIGSPRVSQRLVTDIRRRWPALAAGSAIKADAIALVEMENLTVAEWKIVDRIELR